MVREDQDKMFDANCILWDGLEVATYFGDQLDPLIYMNQWRLKKHFIYKDKWLHANLNC